MENFIMKKIKRLKNRRINLFCSAVFISVFHVMLSIAVRENPANPLFWAYLTCVMMDWDESGLFPPIIGVLVQSIVTTISFKKIMKWNRWRIWIVAEIICLIIIVLLVKIEWWHYIEYFGWYRSADVFFEHLYGGSVIDGMILYLSIQVLYICLYFLLSKINNKDILSIFVILILTH